MSENRNESGRGSDGNSGSCFVDPLVRGIPTVTVEMTIMEFTTFLRAMRERAYHARLSLAEIGGTPQDHVAIERLEMRIGELSLIPANTKATHTGPESAGE